MLVLKQTICRAAVALSSGLLLLTACGGKSEDAGARGLLDGATQAFDARDYTLATQLLDSLQKTFPAEIAIQREALALRPKVIEQATLLKISTNDSLMALNQVTAEQTKKHSAGSRNRAWSRGSTSRRLPITPIS